MWVIVVVVVGLFVIWAKAHWLPTEPAAALRWPLFAQPVMTPREQSFYLRLAEAFPGHIVFVQVALSQLLDVDPKLVQDANRRFALRNKFSQLVADFVLCEKEFRVAAVIEVDDRSHENPTRQHADRRKQVAVESAGLKFVRIGAGRLPTAAEIRTLVAAESNEMAHASVDVSMPPAARGQLSETELWRMARKPLLLLATLVVCWLLVSRLLVPTIMKVGIPSIPQKKHAAEAALAPRVPLLKLQPQAEPAKAPANADAVQSAKGTQAPSAEEVLAARRKEIAWHEFFKPESRCDDPPSWSDQVECANAYMRARKKFDEKWAVSVPPTR